MVEHMVQHSVAQMTLMNKLLGYAKNMECG
jgi:aspartate ammonia-lyase